MERRAQAEARAFWNFSMASPYSLSVASGTSSVERHVAQFRMVRERRQGVEADLALADRRMAVLVRAESVLRVVEVDGAQPVEADDAVELLHPRRRGRRRGRSRRPTRGRRRRARPRGRPNLTWSRIRASCSNVLPTCVPSPAMVCTSTSVSCDGVITSLSAAATLASASSTGLPSALPGCSVYIACGVSAMRARSSASTIIVKSCSRWSALAGFAV